MLQGAPRDTRCFTPGRALPTRGGTPPGMEWGGMQKGALQGAALLELCGSQTSQPRTRPLSSGVSSLRESSSWLYHLWRLLNVALTPLPRSHCPQAATEGGRQPLPRE